MGFCMDKTSTKIELIYFHWNGRHKAIFWQFVLTLKFIHKVDKHGYRGVNLAATAWLGDRRCYVCILVCLQNRYNCGIFLHRVFWGGLNKTRVNSECCEVMITECLLINSDADSQQLTSMATLHSPLKQEWNTSPHVWEPLDKQSSLWGHDLPCFPVELKRSRHCSRPLTFQCLHLHMCF